MMNTQNPGIQAAIQMAGSQTKLARHLTAGQSTINDWLHGRNPVPISVALYLEETFGIPRAAFRTDLGTVCRGMLTYPLIESSRRPFDSGLSSPACSAAMTTEEPGTYLERVSTWEFDLPASKGQYIAEDHD